MGDGGAHSGVHCVLMARVEAEETTRGFANHAQSEFRRGMLADRGFRRGGVRHDYDSAALLSDAAGIYRARCGIGGGAPRDRRYFRHAHRRISTFEIRWTETDCDWIRRSGCGEFVAGTHDARSGPVVD